MHSTNYVVFANSSILKQRLAIYITGVGNHILNIPKWVTKCLKLCPSLSSLGKDVNSVIFCVTNHHSTNYHSVRNGNKRDGFQYFINVIVRESNCEQPDIYMYNNNN
uniref:Uncharacterized protein n=1 Tax=Glossina palpalis gambiensis TaxID=67801 RepID=A0A1B0B814_9MUSC